MSDKNNVNVGSSLSFGTLLGILFIGLKLAKVIDWKWVWVLAPLWIETAIVIVVVGIILFVAYLSER